MSEKIDVCVASLEGKLPKGLENLPVNHVYVETCRPIGKARERLIAKVRTKWFAFIDDDMDITPYWYPVVKQFMFDDVGAINGVDIIKGMGLIDKVIFKNVEPVEITYKNFRFCGNNSLIRKEAAKGWNGEKVYWLEDYDLGKYIFDKGYKIMLAPALIYHYETWSKLRNSSFKHGKEFTKIYDENKYSYIIKKIVEPFKGLFTKGILFSIYAAYRNFFIIYGILKGSDYNE